MGRKSDRNKSVEIKSPGSTGPVMASTMNNPPNAIMTQKLRRSFQGALTLRSRCGSSAARMTIRNESCAPAKSRLTENHGIVVELVLQRELGVLPPQNRNVIRGPRHLKVDGVGEP